MSTDPAEILPVGIPEIAEKLGVRRATVDQWGQRGLLPPRDWTVGGRPAWNWPTIHGWAEATGRYPQDTIRALDLSADALAVIWRARTNAALTAAEFDYDIAVHYNRSVNGVGGVHSPLGAAAHEIARERGAEPDELWAELQPELQAYATRCRDRKYGGWSNAARARGDRITYA